MTPKQETRTSIVFAAIIAAIIALSLVGCKPQKTVTETITEYVHDTVTVHKADTVQIVKITTKTDTVKQIENHTYTLSNQGDTIKEVHHHYMVEKTIVVDSTNRYKATVDSLRAALHEAKSKEKVVVKTRYILRWWEWGIIGVLAVVLIAAVLKRSIKKF